MRVNQFLSAHKLLRLRVGLRRLRLLIPNKRGRLLHRRRVLPLRPVLGLPPLQPLHTIQDDHLGLVLVGPRLRAARRLPHTRPRRELRRKNCGATEGKPATPQISKVDPVLGSEVGL